MTIDSFIYVFLRDMPGLLFELIGEDPLLAQRYRFGSEELKEVSRRIDGVWIPLAPLTGEPLFLAEVQFYKQPEFYRRLMEVAFQMLRKYPEVQDFRAIALFGHPSLEPENYHEVQPLIDSGHITRIYLNDLSGRDRKSIQLEIVSLLAAKPKEVMAKQKL